MTTDLDLAAGVTPTPLALLLLGRGADPDSERGVVPHLVRSLAAGQVVNRITVDPQTAGHARAALDQMLALP
jgi:hypothetical protein